MHMRMQAASWIRASKFRDLLLLAKVAKVKPARKFVVLQYVLQRSAAALKIERRLQAHKIKKGELRR